MIEKTDPRVAQIRKRLTDYDEHRDEPYSFVPEEIGTTRVIRDHAPEDIRLLLELIDQCSPK